jgi:alpha-N-arabinofuranosidase
VGNENWGCGGNFSPEDYGTEYRRYSSYLRSFGGAKPFLIACGPNGNDLDWTRRFFTKMRKDYWAGTDIHGYAAHYYCGTAGTSTEYSEAQWYELLLAATKMEQIVVQQRGLMDAFDPDRKTGLIIDEWGTWHRAEPGRNPAFLWQQNTIRDAHVAAITLNIFNKHADKVVMANIAQTINVLQSLILTDGDRMVTTPTYHVYDLFSAHQGGQALRTLVEGPDLSSEKGRLPLVSASSSLKDSTLTVTLVNSSFSDTVEVDLRPLGGSIEAVLGETILAFPDGDLHAYNTVEEPAAVRLADTSAVIGQHSGNLTLELKPGQVARISARIS